MSEEPLRRVPPKIVMTGNRNRCVEFLGFSRNKLLPELEVEMNFRGLKQFEKTYTRDDGTVVTVSQQHFNGLRNSVIHIHVPEVFDVDEPVEIPEPPTAGVSARFFVKYIVPDDTIQDPDIPAPPRPQRKYEAAWVRFDRGETKTGITVAQCGSPGWDPLPADAMKHVGAELPVVMQQMTGQMHQANYGGKAFEFSYTDAEGKKHNVRFVGYTGSVPLLFRKGKAVYVGAPNLATHQDLDLATIGGGVYMANMHKMLVQNDKHVAWYYYKQEPYFVQGFRGEMDMRFTICTLDLVTVVGDRMQVCVPTNRAVMRGGSSRVEKGAATILDIDSTGEAAVNKWLGDWQSPWAGWYEKLQFPQSLHLFLDVKEIDPTSFAAASKVTLYTTSEDALVEATYSLDPADMGELGYGFGYSYGGYQKRLDVKVVTSSDSVIWTRKGFERFPSLSYEFHLQGHQRYPMFSESYKMMGADHPVFGMIFWDECSRVVPWFRYGGMYGNGGKGVSLPGIGTFGVYSLGFYYQGAGTGRALHVFKKYVGDVAPFNLEILQRYYKNGHFSAGSMWVGQAQVWGEARNNGFCRTERWTQHGPFSIRWRYADGAYTSVEDNNLFNFAWHETYNDPYALGCEMLMPNIFWEKGRKKSSHDHSSSFVNSQSTGRWASDMSESPVGPPPYEPSKATCEEWHTIAPDIPFTLDPSAGSVHHNIADWERVTGYMSGGGERRLSAWSASERHDEEILHCSDGNAAFTLPAGGWEYYFMDDRSVSDDPQGVFIAVKTGTGWRFFHFWENAGTIREYTQEILNGAGLNTPKGRASIQCIGVI